jgi:hypothetical protein
MTQGYFENKYLTKQDLNDEIKKIVKDYVNFISSIKGTVDYFADLPTASAHNNEIWLVRYATTFLGIVTKQAGLYISDGTNWKWMTSLDAKADKTTTINTGNGLTGGGDLSANRTISHADTSTQANIVNTDGNVIQSANLDDFGHITSFSSINLDNRYTFKNNAITGATKTKITYDSKGLITAGADATTTDIAEGTNQYFTNTRARNSISVNSIGSSGVATYDALTGVIAVPNYGLGNSATATALQNARTINGVSFNGTANITIADSTKQPLNTNLTSIGALANSTGLLYNNGTGGFSYLSATTTNISEGTNLYYTNARAISSLLTGYVSGAGTISATDTILSAIQKLNGNISALTTGVSSVFGRTGAVVAIKGDYNLNLLNDVSITTPTNGQVLKYNGTNWVNNTDTDTGITSINTLTALSQTFATGTGGTDFNITSTTSTHTFNLPTASATSRGALSSANWSTFNNKQNTITLTNTGNSGASTFVSNTLNIPNYTLAGLGGQPQLNGTGFVKANGTTISYDNNTYLTANQSITLSGDITGSGTTAITTTLANTGVTAGTYQNSTTINPFTVDSKGRLTSIGTATTITPAFSSITSKPTTIVGYGITDGATLTGSQTLTNKSLSDSTTFIINSIDTTKKATFDAASITTATTRTYTLPNVNGTLITTGDTGTVSNTMLAGSIADIKLNTISTAGKIANSSTTATNANTSNAIVSRDASGNFSAGNITANLSGNATTSTALQTARLINGVSFNGTADITVADSTKLPLTGGTISGNLSLTGSFATGDFLGGTTANFGAGKLRIGGNVDNETNVVLSIAPGVVEVDAPGVVGGRLIINSSGNILIGNPADTSSKLSVNGSGNFAGGISALQFLKTGGTSDEFLKANGTTDVIPYFNPRRGFTHYTDFLRWSAGGDGFFVQTVTGTGATTSNMAAYTNQNVGILRLSTGTTATGRASITTQLDTLALGGGLVTCVSGVSTFTNSDATETYVDTIGLFDNITGVNQVDGVYFLYDTSGASTGSAASGNWQCVTCSNSVRTFTTTTVTVTGSSTVFYNLRIEINSDATLVQFYIDDALVAAHTTNIPVGIARTVGFGAQIIKTVGLTNRVLHLDYMGLTMQFTPQR